MLPATKAERDAQRTQRVTSYNELLEEFSSGDLRSVGNYDVGHLIGKGSFGKVYLASHKLIRNSKVVLKSTRKDDSNLPREVHHHRQFIHPHIARLYEVVVTEASVWLVLEYCPGDELFNYLTKHGPMEVAIVQKIFAQLVGAVAYVHGKSCVHRDLKLENILLDKNGNVKLVDFGFTREYEGKASYLQTWCGTVCYSAPEMLKGEKYAGEKVDVWSLGIILYALLCGELPFDEDDDDNATKMKILKEEPKYPEHMPAEAKELISQLLSKRPLLRPSLSDILNNPWLIEHGPQQQQILRMQQPAPFTTPLEADVLHNMRAAGVNTDRVKDHVISQRCDALAGWWALLLEREERKEERRFRRRRAREAEGRASRRASRASGLELLAATIREEPEEKSPENAVDTRGRDMQRLNEAAVVDTTPKRPILPLERQSTDLLPSAETYPMRETQSTPLSSQKRPITALSANRRRSQLGAGVSRNSSSLGGPLQLTGTAPGALSPDTNSKKLKRRYMQPLASIKQWFRGNHHPKMELPPPKPQSILKTRTPDGSFQGNSNQSNKNKITTPNPKRLSGVNFAPTDNLISSPTTTTATTTTPISRPMRPALSVHTSATSSRRISSHTPSPVTPSSSFRTASRSRALSSHSHASHHRSHTPGRNSTSSSISSVRSSSFGHTRGHASKGSSSSEKSNTTSSAFARSSPHYLNVGNSHPHALPRRSPHSSVKVLPGLPGSMGGAALPSGYRINRAGAPRVMALGEASAAFGVVPGPGSPGLKGPVFARRKRSVFKGPMLGPGLGRDGRRKSVGLGDGRSGSANRLAVTTEEDEEGDEAGDDGEVEGEGEVEEVEEVDYFSPVKGPGEVEILLQGESERERV